MSDNISDDTIGISATGKKIIRFGKKYLGASLSDVPSDYLEMIVNETLGLRLTDIDAAQQELDRRGRKVDARINSIKVEGQIENSGKASETSQTFRHSQMCAHCHYEFTCFLPFGVLKTLCPSCSRETLAIRAPVLGATATVEVDPGVLKNAEPISPKVAQGLADSIDDELLSKVRKNE